MLLCLLCDFRIYSINIYFFHSFSKLHLYSFHEWFYMCLSIAHQSTWLKMFIGINKKWELPHIYFPNCNGPFHNHSWTLKIHYYIIPIQLVTLNFQIEYHQRYSRKLLLKTCFKLVLLIQKFKERKHCYILETFSKFND